MIPVAMQGLQGQELFIVEGSGLRGLFLRASVLKMLLLVKFLCGKGWFSLHVLPVLFWLELQESAGDSPSQKKDEDGWMDEWMGKGLEFSSLLGSA